MSEQLEHASASANQLDAATTLAALHEGAESAPKRALKRPKAIDHPDLTSRGREKIKTGDTRVRPPKLFTDLFQPAKVPQFRLGSVQDAAAGEDCFLLYGYIHKKTELRTHDFRYRQELYLDDKELIEALKAIPLNTSDAAEAENTVAQLLNFLRKRFHKDSSPPKRFRHLKRRAVAEPATAAAALQQPAALQGAVAAPSAAPAAVDAADDMDHDSVRPSTELGSQLPERAGGSQAELLRVISPTECEAWPLYALSAAMTAVRLPHCELQVRSRLVLAGQWLSAPGSDASTLTWQGPGGRGAQHKSFRLRLDVGDDLELGTLYLERGATSPLWTGEGEGAAAGEPPPPAPPPEGNGTVGDWVAVLRRVEDHLARHATWPSLASPEEEERDLGRWLAAQRRLHLQGELPEPLMAALGSLPWWKSEQARAFQARLARLAAAHIAARGAPPGPHEVVPDGGSGVANLGLWCAVLRRKHGQRRLPAELVDSMEAVPGWSWELRGAPSLAGLAAHVEAAGALPSTGDPDANVRALAEWCDRQRRLRSEGSLPGAMQTALEGVPGWSWALPQQRLCQVGEYAQANCKLPSLRDADGYVRLLAGWCDAQRELRAAGKLHAGLAADLEKLPGWTWTRERAPPPPAPPAAPPPALAPAPRPAPQSAAPALLEPDGPPHGGEQPRAAAAAAAAPTAAILSPPVPAAAAPTPARVSLLSGPATLALHAALPGLPFEVAAVLRRAAGGEQMETTEAFMLLQRSAALGLPVSREPPVKPAVGGLFLMSKRRTPYKRDGHAFNRESHSTLKIDGRDRVKAYYASLADSSLQRRCYWDLEAPDLVLVHYLLPNGTRVWEQQQQLLQKRAAAAAAAGVDLQPQPPPAPAQPPAGWAGRVLPGAGRPLPPGAGLPALLAGGVKAEGGAAAWPPHLAQFAAGAPPPPGPGQQERRLPVAQTWPGPAHRPGPGPAAAVAPPPQLQRSGSLPLPAGSLLAAAAAGPLASFAAPPSFLGAGSAAAAAAGGQTALIAGSQLSAASQIMLQHASQPSQQQQLPPAPQQPQQPQYNALGPPEGVAGAPAAPAPAPPPAPVSQMQPSEAADKAAALAAAPLALPPPLPPPPPPVKQEFKQEPSQGPGSPSRRPHSTPASVPYDVRAAFEAADTSDRGAMFAAVNMLYKRGLCGPVVQTFAIKLKLGAGSAFSEEDDRKVWFSEVRDLVLKGDMVQVERLAQDVLGTS